MVNHITDIEHKVENKFDPIHNGMDRRIQKKNLISSNFGVLVLTTVILFALVYFFVTNNRTTKLKVDRSRIVVSTVSRAPFEEFIPVTGSILPIQSFYLTAIEGGRIEKVYVDVGNFVEKGDRILKLANTNLQLDVTYREALSYEQINSAQNRRLTIEQNSIAVQSQLAEVEYQVQRMRRLFDRDSVLANKNLVSNQDFNQTKDEYYYWLHRKVLALETFRQDSILRENQISQLDASITRLLANLEMVKRTVDNLIISAPISGQLTSLNGEVGQSKSPGERLGQIDILDDFKIRVAIDEFYISKIKTSQTGEFDLSGKTYRLAVMKIYPEVRDGKFQIDMGFTDKPSDELRRGQTIQIRLQLSDPQVSVLIARGAFYQKTGGRWIYVVDASGEFATKRPIKLGRQNPEVFEVLEGLSPGEQTITSAYDNFGDYEVLEMKK